VKLELLLTKELFQSGCELAAEDAAQCADRQEEASGRRKPSGAIGSETAGRNNVMYVWMMLKVLSPSVEHAKKPDVCTQVLGVAGQFEQRHCTGSEQKIVKQSLVLQGESREFVRQREDDVKVRDGQQLSSALGQPLGAGVPLTSGAVPVTA
jgi:hypothetical protein